METFSQLWSEWERCDDKKRVREIQCWEQNEEGTNEGLQVASRKGKGTDSSLEPQEGSVALSILWF